MVCACLLLQQTAAFAAGPQVRRAARPAAPVEGVDAPARTDYLGNRLADAIRRQTADSESALLRARHLEAKTREALEKGDARQFYLLERELNDLLISQLSGKVIKNRLYALEHLTVNIREGLLAPRQAQGLFASLQTFLQEQKVCGGQFCDVVGMSAIALALSINSVSKSVPPFPGGELRARNPQEEKRAALLRLYTAMLKRDYGSAQAGNTVAHYVLHAVGYVGGANAVRRAADQLIEQSKKIDLLWGSASVSASATGRHLNKYDVPNAPAQKDAMNVLASLGPEGKKTLEYYAAENRSLPSYAHANIELAYLGATKVPVQTNLENLYCNRKWNLDAQTDFELRQEMGYAYGRGRAPEYVYPTGDYRCRVIVPQRPDPRLQVKAWTDALGAEVLFNVAFVGAGNLFKVLRYAKTLSVYSQSRHGMSLAQFVRKGGMEVLPKFGAAAEREAAVIGNALGRGAEHARIYKQINTLKQRPLSAPQLTKLQQIERAVGKKPFDSGLLGKAKRRLQNFSQKTTPAIQVHGSDLPVNFEPLSSNFVPYLVGKRNYRSLLPWQKQKKWTKYGTSIREFEDAIERMGPLSDELFIHWNTHGGLTKGVWHSALGEEASPTIREMAESFQRIRAVGDTKEITCYLNACYGGTAFDEFMALPASLREGVNLFTPAGGPLQLAYGLPAPIVHEATLSPVQYAKIWWQQDADYYALSGRAYVKGKVLDPLRETIEDMRRWNEPFLFRDLRSYERLAKAKNPQELLRAYEDLPSSFCGVDILKTPGRWDALSFQPFNIRPNPAYVTVSWPDHLRLRVKETIASYFSR